MYDCWIALLLISIAVAQQQIDDPYCFRFTWLGSKFNANSTYLNATCDEVTRGADVPCTRPLVATENSRLPNITYMWTDLSRGDIACRMTPENVCVKYSYYYNNALENITYMCTKVTVENEGAAKSGCYSEYQDGREIEVCVCRSNPGEVPCNTGNTKIHFRLNIIFAVLFNAFLFNIL
ncbi:uncharacterized protein LOC119071591 [Bradysia coprophila]|uniref:uncharacterized protein LOC119071591 n=1 Tax=Bradysia coprophila TaxID=38358 RepID=UPI00187D82FB|nr:uncharacterized protein LOC119071591 [Bradysia coprophila]